MILPTPALCMSCAVPRLANVRKRSFRSAFSKQITMGAY